MSDEKDWRAICAETLRAGIERRKQKAESSFAAPPLLDRVALACAEAISHDCGSELNAARIRPVLEQYLPPNHLTAPREFLVELDSLFSWVMNRGWVVRDGEDRQITERLQRQARAIYERSN